jgi:hypothetical protein
LPKLIIGLLGLPAARAPAPEFGLLKSGDPRQIASNEAAAEDGGGVEEFVCEKKRAGFVG